MTVITPSHVDRNTVRYFQHENMQFIKPHVWPPNIPDLNPLDYIYIIRGVLQQTKFRSADKLKRTIIDAWQTLPQSFIDNRASVNDVAFVVRQNEKAKDLMLNIC